FDRYRTSLKGTWKDEPLPAAGQLFDLGSHLIDQTLALFGRPSKITAFIQNSRGVGSQNVEDTFTVFMHYPAGSVRLYPLTAILRGHILSVKSPQLRYIVKGTKGTYTKFGVDVQEDQLKAISSPKEIFGDGYGQEPESLWGTLENIESDEVTYSLSRFSRWPSNDAGCYVDLFRNLAAAIREGTEQAVKWSDATAVIEMIELAHKSAAEGRTIEVPQI
ncbi:hypothetical protein MPER_03211, partial [Moniliophthora perniciosa FA553]